MKKIWNLGEKKAADLSLCKLVSVKDIADEYQIEADEGKRCVNIIAPQFELSGIKYPRDNYGEYYRFDASKKEEYPERNAYLAHHTSGAKLRFVTNTAYIRIHVRWGENEAPMYHFPITGAYGLDVYVGSGTDRRMVSIIAPFQYPNKGTEYYKDVYLGENGALKEVLVTLPIYGGIEELSIEMCESAYIGLPPKYTYEKPICFYGSSITQGACVSNPSKCYMHLLCNALNAPSINFGFSGSGKGEQVVADYVASKQMSAFFLDYDHNSPSVEHLEATHYNFYKTVRNAHPDIPIVMTSRPDYGQYDPTDVKARKEIVKDTYERAVSEGDKNVWYVDAAEFSPDEDKELYTVDFVHPNDLGHLIMAEALYPVFKKALEG
ncbi:MAG: hypothetical protein E7623_05120 [Ruminococcaceae bacterium]|nr:hypothetical protein [Oscillospiraceae bacterium]